MTGKESIFYFIEYSELKFKFEPISNDWRDIIKEIVVFASDQVITWVVLEPEMQMIGMETLAAIGTLKCYRTIGRAIREIFTPLISTT